MKYSKDEVIQYVQEEDVKFIRLAFCDVFGKQKNISIMPGELPRAFETGIAFDASAIAGFSSEMQSNLFLHPEADTLMPLPWRPEHGRVMQMFSGISRPDGRAFECDTRNLLKNAVLTAREKGLEFIFSAEQEFYLFLLDEHGKPSNIPCDEAGYMDLAPDDHGENIRREICLTLEQMGIRPERSHHGKGPGQNEIDIKYEEPLLAADYTQTFRRVVKTVAHTNGFAADFSPKPLEGAPGNGFHINMSVKPCEKEMFSYMTAGILSNMKVMTLFMNPLESSYACSVFGRASGSVLRPCENQSQLIRISASASNPYLAFALLIYAALDGIENKKELQKGSEKLPQNIDEARAEALESEFIKKYLPEEIISVYLGK